MFGHKTLETEQSWLVLNTNVRFRFFKLIYTLNLLLWGKSTETKLPKKAKKQSQPETKWLKAAAKRPQSQKNDQKQKPNDYKKPKGKKTKQKQKQPKQAAKQPKEQIHFIRIKT